MVKKKTKESKMVKKKTEETKMDKQNEESKVLMAPGWQDLWRDHLKGVTYLENYTTFLLLRAVRLGMGMKIFTGMEQADKFGDVVLQIDEKGIKHHQLIHFRRETNPKKINITTYQLTSTEKNAPFGLLGYFNSFRKIKKAFIGNGNEISDLVICTNGKIVWPVKQSLFGISLSMWDSFYEKRDGIFFTKHGNVLGCTFLWLRNDSNIRKLWARFLKENVEIKDNDLEQDIETFLDKIRLTSEGGLSEVKVIKEKIFQELDLLGIKTLPFCDPCSFIFEKVLECRRRAQEYHLNTVDGRGMIDELKNISQVIEFGVEKPEQEFFGRLEELHQIISECKTNRLEMMITGIAGVGKTELAKNFVAKWKSTFHCVFWMKGECTEDLIDSFKELAFQKLSIDEKGKDGKEKGFKIILQEINMFLKGRRCLLILDNVLPKGQASDKSYMKKFLSLLTFKPFLLMTSRHEPWDGVSILPLKELKKDDACEMVKKSLKSKDTQVIRSLTEQLNYYPLALKLAISYIKENPQISSYLENFNRIFKNLRDKVAKIPITDKYMITTMVALEVILLKLRNQWTEKCLQIISFMRPDEIDVHEVAIYLETTIPVTQTCFKTLHGYGVIFCAEKKVSRIKRVKISDILQLSVRSTMPEEDEIKVLDGILRATQAWKMNHDSFIWNFVCKHKELVREHCHLPILILKKLKEEEKYEEGYEFGCKNVKILSKCLSETNQSLLDAIKLLADITYHYGEESEALELYQDLYIKLKRVQGERNTETILIREKIASLLLETNKFNESFSIYQEILKCLEKTLHKSDPKVLQTRCYMALNLAKLGKNEESASSLKDICASLKGIRVGPESLSIKSQVANVFLQLRKYEESLSNYRDVHEGFVRLLGPYHVDALRAQCSIAMILGKLGENSKSLEIYKAVNASMKRVLGCEHPDTLSTCQSIVTLLNELGRYEESLNIAKILRETSVRVLGENDRVTLKIKEAIALSLRKLGKSEDSLAKFKEIYPAMKQVFGEDDPLTVNTGNNIASLLFELGKYKDSHEFYIKIYPSLKKSLGEMHSDVLNGGFNLAITYIEMGKYKEGHELCNGIYLCCKRILGVDHPDTLRSGCRVALMLGKLGRGKESLVILEEQLDRMKKVFGDDHLETLNAMGNIASALNALGKFEESFKVYEEVCNRKRNLFGNEHPEVLSVECKMAAYLREVGKNEESLSMYRELLSRMQNVLGEKHVDVLNVKCCIASTLRELGRYDCSLEMYKEVYNQAKTLHGEEDFRALAIRSDIALTEEKLGKYGKSLSTHMEIHRIMKKLLGEDHPSTINAHGNVAGTLISLGKRTSGIDILHEMKERLNKVLGEEHPETLRVASKIAHTLAKMKKYKESLAMYDEVCSLMRKVMGDEHKVTLKTRNEISWVLRNSGRNEESLALSMEIYQIMMKVLGKEHPETLKTMNDIASTLSKLEKFDECLNMYNEVYQGMKAIFGEENLETIKTKETLDLILQKVKKT